MRVLSRLKNKKELTSLVIDQERYYDQQVRRITPSLIQEHHDHIIIDNEVYATCMVVGVPPYQTGRGFPKTLPDNFTDQIMAIEATSDYLVGISYTCEPITHEEAQNLIDNGLYKNKISRHDVDIKTAKSTGTSAHSLRYEKESNDFVSLYNDIYDSEKRLFDSQYIVTLWSNSHDGLQNGLSRLKGVMRNNIVHFEIPYYSILETFMAAQPYPQTLERTTIQQVSDDCGALLPLRDPLSPLANTGLIYGERKVDHAPFIVDIDRLAAGHHLIVGSTGSGKTVLLMKLLMGCYDLLGHRFVYITPKPDPQTNYLAVAEYYKDKATVINIGSKAGYNNINPLQVIIDNSFQTDDDLIEAFNNHLELVTSFFGVLDTSENMDNYVNESLIEVYRRAGIIRKDPATWKNLPGDKWPVLLDMREIWKEDAKNKNPSATAMLNRTSRLETSWEYINRPTDVKFDMDIIIVDISGVPSTLRDAMNVFVVGMVGMRFNTDLTKKTNVIIDEGRVFLNDKKLAEFILKMYTQGRSFGLNAWFTTQQPSDAKDDDVKDLLKNNSFVNVILGNVQPNSYQTIKDFFNLSEEDINNLKGCGVGQGLVQVNNTVTPVKFSLTDLEERVILHGDKNTRTRAGGVIQLVDDRLFAFAEEHHAYLDDWIVGDSKVVAPGRTYHKVQLALENGTTGIWIETALINDNKVLTQSIDHYATVLQIASYCLTRGCTVEVNHMVDTDICLKLGDATLAIEYERPGTHSTTELIEKNQKHKSKYGSVLFVVTYANYKSVSAETCIGAKNTVRRGNDTKEYIEKWIQEHE